MAAMLKELADITECSICTGVFSNPRVLPCIHTYCMPRVYPGLEEGVYPGLEERQTSRRQTGMSTLQKRVYNSAERTGRIAAEFFRGENSQRPEKRRGHAINSE